MPGTRPVSLLVPHSMPNSAFKKVKQNSERLWMDLAPIMLAPLTKKIHLVVHQVHIKTQALSFVILPQVLHERSIYTGFFISQETSNVSLNMLQRSKGNN